ncbi:MAG: cytochrome c1 [Woeseiaceae bacterium]|nr:cytochrome c1 [Woeseiaceae bacterium]
MASTRIAAAVLLLSAGLTMAAEAPELEPAQNDATDIHSLQRGARNFMNYCAGCHSAKYVRFNSIADDLELTDELMIQNLMFNAEKTFETITNNMSAEESARWFGRTPPDLSLMARARTTDYIYNFLKGFYIDPDSPTGVDNRVLAGTSMPHVLWELQGFQRAVFSEDEFGQAVFERFELHSPGSMSADEFDSFVRDTVNFLEFISEPVRSTRRAIGVWVLGFLAIFLIFAALLKKQIWKDVS